MVDVSILPTHDQPCNRHHETPNERIIDRWIFGWHKVTYWADRKHPRWGITLWVRRDAISHYCAAFFFNIGARNEDNAQTEHGEPYNVLIKLLEVGNYLRKGYHLFLDNFFWIIPLAKYLYHILTKVDKNAPFI